MRRPQLTWPARLSERGPSRHANYVSVFPRRSDDSAAAQKVTFLFEHVDPLAYPLAHVAGTLGYSPALQTDAVGPRKV
eukprot:596415-Pyramimonas_sp.AAC.1